MALSSLLEVACGPNSGERGLVAEARASGERDLSCCSTRLLDDETMLAAVVVVVVFDAIVVLEAVAGGA